MTNYAVNGQRAITDLSKSTDGDDHYLVGAQYDANSTNLNSFSDVNAATTIRGGKGNDSFTVTKAQTSDTLTIEGGEGKDQISLNTNAKTTIKISDGDSVKGSNDVIYGFKTGDKDKLDLATTTLGSNEAAAAADIASDIKAWETDAKGKAKFYSDAAHTQQTVVNSKNLDSVLKYLAEKFNNTGKTVAFDYDRDGDGTADSTYVFQDGVKDTVVELAGTTGTTGLHTGAGAGANDIVIS